VSGLESYIGWFKKKQFESIKSLENIPEQVSVF
jgi:hypothetical protein